MVKFWLDAKEDAIKITKRRIKLMEKHGRGMPAMEEKRKLVTQELSLKKWKENNN